MSRIKPLSHRQMVLAAAFHRNGGNAMRAALEAGYSEKTAQRRGYQLIRHPGVQELLARMRDATHTKLVEIANVTAAQVVAQFGVISMVEPTSFLKEVEPGRFAFKSPSELDAAQRAAVKKVKLQDHMRKVPRLDKDGNPTGATDWVFDSQTYDYQLYDKMEALYHLGTHFQLFEKGAGRERDITPDKFKDLSDDEIRRLRMQIHDALEGEFKQVLEGGNGAVLSDDRRQPGD